MPTEIKAAPFEREERYIVLKLKRLPKDEVEYLRDCHPKAMVECVVVESDWPEYQLVWAMIEHRMAGKPVPDFNLWCRADALQALLTAADERADVQQQRLTELQRQLGERWSEISAYQDTVEKQSERADVLEGLLREAMPALDLAASAFKSAMPARSKVRAALKPAEGRNEPNCLRCLDKKTVPSNLAEGYVMDRPDCCGEEG